MKFSWAHVRCAGLLLLCTTWLLTGCRGLERAQPGVLLNQPETGTFERTVTFAEQTRSYLLHVPPSYNGQTPLPLVLVLHGGGGSARNIMQTTGMNNKADAEGFFVLYPNGSGRLRSSFLTWNAGQCCGYAMRTGVDDVGFIRTLLSGVTQEFAVNPQRIYATGFSNGAMMSLRLGCEMTSTLAAIAPVAGYFAYPECRPTQPLPVLLIHGTRDERIPYAGGTPALSEEQYTGRIAPVADLVAFWVQHNGCGDGVRSELSAQIVQVSYAGCRANSEVQVYTLEGGGTRLAWRRTRLTVG